MDYLDLRDKFPPAIGPDPETKRRTREQWGWTLDPNGRPGVKAG